MRSIYILRYVCLFPKFAVCFSSHLYYTYYERVCLILELVFNHLLFTTYYLLIFMIYYYVVTFSSLLFAMLSCDYLLCFSA